VELAALVVAAGSYVITAKLVVGTTVDADPLEATCTLSTGDRIDAIHYNVTSAGNRAALKGTSPYDDYHRWPVTLHDVASCAQPTRIALLGDFMNFAWRPSGVVLTAVKVGAINPKVDLVGLVGQRLDASHSPGSLNENALELDPHPQGTRDLQLHSEMASLVRQMQESARAAAEGIERVAERERELLEQEERLRDALKKIGAITDGVEDPDILTLKAVGIARQALLATEPEA